MKKIQKLIIFVLLLVLNISTANAEAINIFNKDWETQDRHTTQNIELPIITRGSVHHKEGYLIYDLDSDLYYTTGEVTGIISIYNTKGNEIKSITFPNKMVITAIEHDGYYYIVKTDAKETIPMEEANTWITKYDSNLNQIKEIKTSVSLIFLVEYKYSGNIDFINVYNNKINAYTYDLINDNAYILSYDLNLEQEDKIFIETDEDLNKVKDTFEIIKIMDKPETINENEYINYYGYYKRDNITIKSGEKVTKSQDGQGKTYSGLLRLYEKNKMVFEKYYDDYAEIFSPYKIQDYIIAKAYKEDGKVYIVIFDLEGNIVQTIHRDYISTMSYNDNSFIFSSFELLEESCPTVERDEASNPQTRTKFNINEKILERVELTNKPTCVKMNFEYYSIPLKIETIESNDGEIEISTNAEVGEEITYTVKPKEGYKIDQIIIKDSQGNIIETKDNKFIMPAYNVTIEAVFVVDNPNTVDVALLSLIIIGFFSILFLYINKNSKLTKIKEYE